jgi:hypothetical protein
VKRGEDETFFMYSAAFCHRVKKPTVVVVSKYVILLGMLYGGTCEVCADGRKSLAVF